MKHQTENKLNAAILKKIQREKKIKRQPEALAIWVARQPLVRNRIKHYNKSQRANFIHQLAIEFRIIK